MVQAVDGMMWMEPIVIRLYHRIWIVLLQHLLPGYASGSVFPVGVTTVSYTATDAGEIVLHVHLQLP